MALVLTMNQTPPATTTVPTTTTVITPIIGPGYLKLARVNSQFIVYILLGSLHSDFQLLKQE